MAYDQTADCHDTDAAAFMRSVLQRIATGPELSKDISREEARRAMTLVLDEAVNPVQAGVFLIALRMKRETDEETQGILDAVRAATRPATAEVEHLLDLADPYDGYTRSLPAAPFLPAVLAACGVPTISHGVECVGPKFGVTHHQVLVAAGVDAGRSAEAAAACIAEPTIGWAYVDQSTFCPKLHALVGLRNLIVKRPAVTTVEGLTGAVRARGRTHLVTGYVHKPYPGIYAVLARGAGYHSALLVRGVEGGVIPSLRRTGRCFFYREGEAPATSTATLSDRDQGAEPSQHTHSLDLRPADFGLQEGLRPPPLPGDLEPESGGAEDTGPEPALARAAAAAGRAALDGAPGPTRDSLVCGAALCLWHLGRHPTLAAAADAVRAVLDSGRAGAHFDAGK
ncbi:MAG: anthranilate phosphoribosyltransferase [Gammaproteobacteria bacterium]|nr:anthranilate phosphoribosyltransferase [Gammaproteobacteria bacterium]NIR81990.1 anthranilate phosphoribosyltransferase [Gammaproteobacteria bacterium]NIR89047.1 anthranilate phosphoribosyltransferase [Gammaproteobacteria bacterium]NIU03097.1 anthranilate phosphoribosyltransferase [Gammaproteobacteria bacterium]NIV50621.1 anthranilate phosphoribosyltransferase [Gammaproteobacteria bacterium]